MKETRRWLTTFIRTSFKWFTRFSAAVVIFLAVPNPISHAILEGLGPLLGFEEPSLATLLGVAIVILILERVIVIEDEIPELIEAIRNSGPLRVDQRVDPRNVEWGDLIKKQQKVRRVYILLFTGHRMGDLLDKVATLQPNAKVRLLLCHPERAAQFDRNDTQGEQQVHALRIGGTIDRVNRLKKDRKEKGFNFKVDIRYYTAMPSVSAVILDRKYVNLGWYRYFLLPEKDAEGRDVMSIEGHSSITITGSGKLADPLFDFGRAQFKALWDTGEKVPLNP